MKIAIDVGFGDTKVVSFLNKKINKLKFPTAISYYKSGFNLGDFSKKELIYNMNGVDYLVGVDAIKDALTTRDIDFLIKFSPLFIYKALTNLNLIKENIDLALGLPLLYYSDYSDALKKSMINSKVNDLEFKNYIKTVRVYPQGVGILMNQMIDDNMKINSSKIKNSIIVDVGYNTVDIIVTSEGKAIKNECAFYENKGIIELVNGVKNAVRNEFKIEISEAEAQKILIDKEFLHTDFSKTINIEKQKYAEWLDFELKGKFKDRFVRADEIIISGGGANYLKEFSNKKNFTISSSEYSNAIGFLKLSTNEN